MTWIFFSIVISRSPLIFQFYFCFYPSTPQSPWKYSNISFLSPPSNFAEWTRKFHAKKSTKGLSEKGKYGMDLEAASTGRHADRATPTKGFEECWKFVHLSLSSSPHPATRARSEAQQHFLGVKCEIFFQHFSSSSVREWCAAKLQSVWGIRWMGNWKIWNISLEPVHTHSKWMIERRVNKKRVLVDMQVPIFPVIVIRFWCPEELSCFLLVSSVLTFNKNIHIF